MNLTHHASVRRQQRAIPELVIDLLLQFGKQESAGQGTTKYFLDGASRRKIIAYAGPLARSLEEHLNLYVVVGENNAIVTVAHRIDRIKRH